MADEVGLGKTIEAGLVIAQLLAEGAERGLLITPKALLGQWRQELFQLFSITATEYEPGVDLAVPGVFLVTRDFAGGDKGSELLKEAPPFDLCVIDEVHEIFAGIYKMRVTFCKTPIGEYPQISIEGVIIRHNIIRQVNLVKINRYITAISNNKSI